MSQIVNEAVMLSNSKYLKDLLDNKLISNNDCQKCLNFCHFTNPIFIIGTIGYTFLHDKKPKNLNSFIDEVYTKCGFKIDYFDDPSQDNALFVANYLKWDIIECSDGDNFKKRVKGFFFFFYRICCFCLVRVGKCFVFVGITRTMECV